MTRRFPSGPVVASLDGLVLTAAGVEAFDCPFCGDVRDLVVPDCDDGVPGGDHDECPDRACAQCGFALVLGSSSQDRSAGPGDAGRPAVARSVSASTASTRRAG